MSVNIIYTAVEAIYAYTTPYTVSPTPGLIRDNWLSTLYYYASSVLALITDILLSAQTVIPFFLGQSSIRQPITLKSNV